MKSGFSRSVHGERLTGYLQKERLGWELRAGRASSPLQGFIVLAKVFWRKQKGTVFIGAGTGGEESQGLEGIPLGD